MQALARSLATIALLAASMVASAQTWPTKNVRILVGAPPGGGTDIIARLLADKFANDDVGERFFRMILACASGEQSKSERHGYGQNGFVPWQLSVIT